MITYRNPTYNRNGHIDCEVLHGQRGWIPFTASPDDSNPQGVELYNYILANDTIAPYQSVNDTVVLSVTKDKLQSYLESLGNWTFVKLIKDSKPKYIDFWDSADLLTSRDELARTIARAIGQTPTDLITNAISYVMPNNPTADLDDAKNIAKTLVTAERDRRKFLPVSYNGNLFSVSEWDMMMIMSLMITSNNGSALPTGDYWRTANDININLSNSDLNNLDGLIRAQVQAAYVWSWTKKAEIEACTTVAEVEAVNLELTV